MKRFFALLTIVTVVVAALLLTACGSTAQDAEVAELQSQLDAAEAALEEARAAGDDSAEVEALQAELEAAQAALEEAEAATIEEEEPTAAGEEIVVYMQMGGQQGDPSTLARTNGAKAAAEALGITLIEQYSGWDPQMMIDQFKEAIAAEPDGIVIMGHPGEDAMEPLVDEARELGIIVTSGNNPLPNIEAKYQTAGFGYAGADLYAGGYLTGTAMIAAGLEAGDEALVYGLWHQEGRSRSPQGVFDALEEAGLTVEQLDITDDVDKDASLAIPILTAYIESHPNLKAIGTQHGNITAIMPKVLEAAGKESGDIIIGGIDLSPATIEGIKSGYVSASFDQVLYLQGYFPVQQIWLTKNYLIPGLHIDTGVGTVRPDNVGEIEPLIEQGIR
ncbi:MAG: substrate-binding domain-containing protein [Anaerolineae bacterium]|nr:substrate-binding domain-containing protein [Anaerolineae bacterium]